MQCTIHGGAHTLNDSRHGNVSLIILLCAIEDFLDTPCDSRAYRWRSIRHLQRNPGSPNRRAIYEYPSSKKSEKSETGKSKKLNACAPEIGQESTLCQAAKENPAASTRCTICYLIKPSSQRKIWLAALLSKDKSTRGPRRPLSLFSIKMRLP